MIPQLGKKKASQAAPKKNARQAREDGLARVVSGIGWQAPAWVAPSSVILLPGLLFTRGFAFGNGPALRWNRKQRRSVDRRAGSLTVRRFSRDFRSILAAAC